MTLQEELLDLEEQFWTRGADFYGENLAAECLMIFQEPVGMLPREAAIDTISSGPRWDSVDFEEARMLTHAESVVTLAYRARARRSDSDAPYSAYASSTYLKRDGSWKLSIHQQTPDADE